MPGLVRWLKVSRLRENGSSCNIIPGTLGSWCGKTLDRSSVLVIMSLLVRDPQSIASMKSYSYANRPQSIISLSNSRNKHRNKSDTADVLARKETNGS